MGRLLALFVACSVSAFARGAIAQESAPVPPPAPVPPVVTAPVAPAVQEHERPIVVVQMIPAPPVAEVDEHSKVVHRLAIGYQGVSQLPIAASAPSPGEGSPPKGTVTAPVLGARYWFGPRVGLDVGVGFAAASGSDQPTSSGFALHVGVPIALAHAGHYAFEIIPEASAGVTHGKIAGVVEQTVSGTLLRAGVRSGAEVHFGFIGMPQLALQATIGLYVLAEKWTWKGSGPTSDGSSTLLTTSVGPAPWSIFTDNITALYYF